MISGWFDAFRENGEPTWFNEIKSPLPIDTFTVAIFWLFLTPLIAFLIILPGVRKRKGISSISFILAMTTGATILVSIYYPGWHESNARIFSSYRSFSSSKIHAKIGVKIGLKHVNITLKSLCKDDLLENETISQFSNQFLYNERFKFDEVSTLSKELLIATKKGLPYPILKVVEYLSVNGGGFPWGREYRLAGYYATFCLWLAFGFWILLIVFICLLPHHTFHISSLVGVSIITADFIYAYNIPKPLIIRFEGPNKTVVDLVFNLSTCFYSTLLAGTGSLIFGVVGWIMQDYFGYQFKTFFTGVIDDNVVRSREKFDWNWKMRYYAQNNDKRELPKECLNFEEKENKIENSHDGRSCVWNTFPMSSSNSVKEKRYTCDCDTLKNKNDNQLSLAINHPHYLRTLPVPAIISKGHQIIINNGKPNKDIVSCIVIEDHNIGNSICQNKVKIRRSSSFTNKSSKESIWTEDDYSTSEFTLTYSTSNQICLGTTNGPSRLSNLSHYEMLKNQFSYCNRISGNLEITHINGLEEIKPGEKPFDFLKHIEEIRGYLLIYQVENVPTIAMPNLRVIWGDNLFDPQHHREGKYSVYVGFVGVNKKTNVK
uniref:Recep_L_domain domain-containing protein n=1 Tax=Parastrongyloides trichosuri TaxID=131310 RepID=A0A0N4ZWZ4_PARTI